MAPATDPSTAPAPRVLVLSNGHGEDEVGARLVAALSAHRSDLDLVAFPTVGEGRAYADGPARRTGPLRVLPSGGMTVRSASALVRDARAGLVGTTLAQARDLRDLRADVLVTVGDVWIEALGLLPRARRRYAVQTLISARMDDGRARLGLAAFRHRFTALERRLLRAAYARVYARDADTAAALRAAGVRRARFLGNPMMDGLDAAPLADDRPGLRVACAPGTREHAAPALALMLDAVGRAPGVAATVAWAGAWPPTPPVGWRTDAHGDGEVVWRPAGGSEVPSGDAPEVRVVAGRWAEVLAGSVILLGTSGTAHEQAAGRGLPVIAFPVGTAYPPAFLATQRRLLGDALEVVEPTPDAVATALRRLVADPEARARRGAAGRAAMGGPGGAEAVATDLLADAAASGVVPPRDTAGGPEVASGTGDP